MQNITVEKGGNIESVVGFIKNVNNYGVQVEQKISKKIPFNTLCEGRDWKKIRSEVDSWTAYKQRYKLNKQDAKGYKPLMSTCVLLEEDAVEMVQYFLEKGANPNLANEDGDDALIIAVKFMPMFDGDSLNQINAVKILINHDADLTHANSEGYTAKQIVDRRSLTSGEKLGKRYLSLLTVINEAEVVKKASALSKQNGGCNNASKKPDQLQPGGEEGAEHPEKTNAENGSVAPSVVASMNRFGVLGQSNSHVVESTQVNENGDLSEAVFDSRGTLLGPGDYGNLSQ